MAKPFSKDLRERIVSAHNNGSGTIEETARLFGVSKSAVEKYLRISREDGDLTPIKPPGRPPILNKRNLYRLKQIILASPDKRLVDYSIIFKKKTGIHLPITTLWDACKTLNIRRKKRVFTQKNKIAQEFRANEKSS